jgi:hypothetical protein
VRTNPNSIVGKIVRLHAALEKAELPHAFGGALALAWCTERARGTIDIDVNVFVDSSRSAEVFASLPRGVRHDDDDLRRCLRDGQVRLWWDTTPLDLFTNTTGFHVAAADRAIIHEFGGAAIPFLSCSDLAVFKAFFNRPKDWVDLDEMITAGTLNADLVLGVLVRYLDGSDERVARLKTMTADAR